jgi:hypothetical protein
VVKRERDAAIRHKEEALRGHQEKTALYFCTLGTRKELFRPFVPYSPPCEDGAGMGEERGSKNHSRTRERVSVYWYSV